MDGTALRNIRTSLGLTTVAVAAEAGVTPSAVTLIEQSRHLRPKTADRYLSALGRLADATGAERDRRRVEELLSAASA